MIRDFVILLLVALVLIGACIVANAAETRPRRCIDIECLDDLTDVQQTEIIALKDENEKQRRAIQMLWRQLGKQKDILLKADKLLSESESAGIVLPSENR